MPASASSLDVELSPKWIALREVLEEVDEQADDFILRSKGSPSTSSDRSKVNVLVLALDEKLCKQIYQVRLEVVVFIVVLQIIASVLFIFNATLMMKISLAPKHCLID